MALPTNDTWFGDREFPSRLFDVSSTDYELYEEDGEFVLSVELPGFAPEEIDVNWYDGRLNISAEREDEGRGTRKTYHRTFRMPKEIDPAEIDAIYENGVLEVRLPVLEGAGMRGHTIEVQG
ncbi:MAG: Hsp20/alpha crystallin family protein [Halobacteriales archaeon]